MVFSQLIVISSDIYKQCTHIKKGQILKKRRKKEIDICPIICKTPLNRLNIFPYLCIKKSKTIKEE